jgi:hypothetical protein
MTESRLHPFERELIGSITDEHHYFDMQYFTTQVDSTITATCNTASCMGGHIQALRSERAEELFDELIKRNEIAPHFSSIHASIARIIYKEETGKPCKLDFFAVNHRRPLGEQTREDAIAHIKGWRDWPQLEEETYSCMWTPQKWASR